MGMGPFEMWQFNLVIYFSLKKHVAVPVCTGFALTLGGERCLRAALLRHSGRLTKRMSGHGMTTLRPFSDLFYFACR